MPGMQGWGLMHLWVEHHIGAGSIMPPVGRVGVQGLGFSGRQRCRGTATPIPVPTHPPTHTSRSPPGTGSTHPPGGLDSLQGLRNGLLNSGHYFQFIYIRAANVYAEKIHFSYFISNCEQMLPH